MHWGGNGDTLELRAGATAVTVAPSRGGGLLSFDWHGMPVFRRAAASSSPLDLASFPLVPYSNRIAFGRFTWRGRGVALPPNFPDGPHPHAIHGSGWLAAWDVVSADATSATLRYVHRAGDWPWDFVAEQHIAVDVGGYTHDLSITNQSHEPAPAGLGLHPYLPRAADTRLIARHHGEWQTGADGLPIRLDARDAAIDWWGGQPVGSRIVDTVYGGRTGDLRVEWPDRALALTIRPSDQLIDTVIFTPAGLDFFCVEPVSHPTDAFNRGGMMALGPGDTLSASVRFDVARLD